MTAGSPETHVPATGTWHPARLVPVVLWMGVIFAFSAREHVPKPPGFSLDVTAMAGHLAVYAVLAALTWRALGGLVRFSRQQMAAAFGIAVLYGFSDEWHQAFVPGRTPDPWDLVVDAIGAVIGIAIAIEAGRYLARRRSSVQSNGNPSTIKSR
jgi:VanZ family protein